MLSLDTSFYITMVIAFTKKITTFSQRVKHAPLNQGHELEWQEQNDRETSFQLPRSQCSAYLPRDEIMFSTGGGSNILETGRKLKT